MAFSGVSKDSPIITPLMDFVRQKRAAKGASRVIFATLLKLTKVRSCVVFAIIWGFSYQALPLQ